MRERARPAGCVIVLRCTLLPPTAFQIGCQIPVMLSLHLPFVTQNQRCRGNFLYDEATGRINLLDFGAAREYPAAFVGDYLEMVVGCANRDREQVILRSTSLGFLTGELASLDESGSSCGLEDINSLSRHAARAATRAEQHLPPAHMNKSRADLTCNTGDESAVMLDAHTEAGFLVGVPFAEDGVYDFATHGNKTAQVAKLGAVMLQVACCCAQLRETLRLHKARASFFKLTHLCLLRMSLTVWSKVWL